MKIISESKLATLAKEISTRGIFSPKPSERAICRVRIETVNDAGPRPDSEYVESPVTEKLITVGDANTTLDDCVERAITSMFVGEESLFEIALRLADDTNAFLTLRLSLLSFEARRPIWEWSVTEKLEASSTCKEAGVRLYKSGKTVEAFRKFAKACKFLITLEPIERDDLGEALFDESNALRKNLYNNMVECHLSRKNFDHAVALCDKVLQRDGDNVKALYRRALARENQRDYEKALADINRVVVLEPTNLAAKKKQSFYASKVCEAQRMYDDMVRKMFNAN